MEKDTTKFDLELYDALNLLNECQMNTQKKLSCIGCVNFFVCKQRKDYADYELGLKIADAVETTGQCEFTAEF